MNTWSYQRSVNASFGEIIQGCLPNDTEFLVTLPIKSFSKATFKKNAISNSFVLLPKHKNKSLKLIELIGDKYKIFINGLLIINSEVEEGKGLSSSSADLVACARVISDAYNLRLSNLDIDELLFAIEPSDGVAYSGIIAYDYKKCRFIEKLSSCVPQLTVICHDEGGIIETKEVSNKSRIFTASEKNKYQLLYNQLALSLHENDLNEIGRISTESTLMWQEKLPKSYLGEVLNVAKLIKALGLVNTHSGTCLGILLDRTDSDLLVKIKKARELLKNISVYET